MSEKALVIRAEGNSHVLEFSPQDLRDVISDIVRTDDVIGILFLDRLSRIQRGIAALTVKNGQAWQH
jgi:hypothetical protein